MEIIGKFQETLHFPLFISHHLRKMGGKSKLYLNEKIGSLSLKKMINYEIFPINTKILSEIIFGPNKGDNCNLQQLN